MRYYFAPMEGVTGYIYRNAHQEFYPGIDKYFTPFIATNKNLKFKSREINDILPEHNEGICLVPQLLSNNARDFIEMAREISNFGYKEINLNLGCPSGTVVAKHKGSGFLAKPEQLDCFLEEIFTYVNTRISIKTRIGKDNPDEFEQLLTIYNKYPIEELTIHPRIQTDFYKNQPNLTVFSMAIKESKNPICYNGDLYQVRDCVKIQEDFSMLTSVMIGRGLIRNPNLIQEVTKGENHNKKVLKQFHDKIYHDYQNVLFGDKNVIFKMREIWFYMSSLFTNYEQYEKKIKKTEKMKEYEKIVEDLFQYEELVNEAKPGF